MIENEVVKLKAIGDEFGLKVGVILNKVQEAKADVDAVIELLEGSVGVPVLGTVALDNMVPMALNEGIPTIEAFPRCMASKDIRRVGESLVEWMLGEEKKSLLQTISRRIHKFFNPYLHWD